MRARTLTGELRPANRVMVLSRPLRSVYATLLCAIVFFLASSDRLFTVRTNGVNVCFACFPLFAGFIVWIFTRASSSRDDIRWLAIAWLPFLTLYLLAGETSDTFAPATLKVAWFAFDFMIVYGSTSLF